MLIHTFIGWHIIGSGTGQTNASTPEIENIFPIPTNDQERRHQLLVVGNEGEGVPPSLLPKCHSFEWIGNRRSLHPYVDSLNVSVATALLLEKLQQQI